MSKASDYMENALMNSFFGKTDSPNFGTISGRPTLYVALCTVSVTDSMTGTTITEPTGGEYNEYARQSTVPADWDPSSGGIVDNASAIVFPKLLTGTGCTIIDVAVCDSASGGNLLFYGTLNTSMPLVVGSTPEFEAGDFDCQFS